MMMSLGHEVIHYGVEGSNPPCTENVQVMTKVEQSEFFGGHDHRTQGAIVEWDGSKPYWLFMNGKIIAEMARRVKHKDFIAVTTPIQDTIADTYRGITIPVEYTTGYTGIGKNHKVFPSYTHMHYVYGQYRWNEDGRYYDSVIPHYVDPDDFSLCQEKGDYYLYLGRIMARKGIHIALTTTEHIGAKLIIAGQGGKLVNGRLLGDHLDLAPGNWEYVGPADVKKRSELMGHAKAVFVPSTYLEPFGLVAIEAQACGTPVITTDWGAFVETVEHGVTGFRCRTLDHFVWAAQNVHTLDPKTIREKTLAKYSIDRIKLAYDEYFHMLYDLWGDGWNVVHDDRVQLDWLKK